MMKVHRQFRNRQRPHDGRTKNIHTDLILTGAPNQITVCVCECVLGCRVMGDTPLCISRMMMMRSLCRAADPSCKVASTQRLHGDAQTNRASMRRPRPPWDKVRWRSGGAGRALDSGSIPTGHTLDCLGNNKINSKGKNIEFSPLFKTSC